MLFYRNFTISLNEKSNDKLKSMINKILLSFIIIFLPISIGAQTFSATGTYKEETPGGGMGLKSVFVFNSFNGATITYTASSSVTIIPYIYVNNQADRTPLSSSDYTTTSNSCTITNLQDGRGYMLDVGGQWESVWVIDYSQHQPVLNSIDAIEAEDKCEFLKLLINRTEDVLEYRGTVAGMVRAIPRTYTIEYENLKWNDSDKKFEDELVIRPEEEIGTEVVIAAPLKDTRFILKGDQYAKYFNITKELVSAEYTAVAVKGDFIIDLNGEDVTENLEDKGYSAPIKLSLLGVANEPVAHYFDWKIYNTKDPENPILERKDRDINEYEFIDSGTYRVVFEIADRSSQCVSTPPYEKAFNIAESFLDAPNYFSPGDSPGSNDEFRVVYRSLVQFKCTIFNRWGVKIYEWTDPDKGWDGRHNGRYVAPGVYFYVIQAKGSEGKTYKKKGDINILRSK